MARYRPAGATFNSSTGVFQWDDPGPPGSEHFLVFRAFDPSGAVASRVVKITVEPDSVAPDTIADLDAPYIAQTLMYVEWTAPGDDSTTGKACEYDLRYSTSVIDSCPPNSRRAPCSHARAGAGL